MSERLTQPQTFLIGYSDVDETGLKDYLRASGNADFEHTYVKAVTAGLSPAEALCSFYAKLCYKSLVLGQNANVNRIRDVEDNIKGCFNTGHGSVFEHVCFNFVTTNCSRVFTHELVRHRVGIAFSQTSGRYVRIEPGNLKLVWDPILEGCEGIFDDVIETIELGVYQAECRLGLRKPPDAHPQASKLGWVQQRAAGDPNWKEFMWVPDSTFNMTKRKKITSAIRRIAPNGQTNEMGWSANLRCIRQLMQIRTSRFAEYEIRLVFNQVYHLLKDKFPLMFHGARETEIDGLLEITEMKLQPWERVLADHTTEEIDAELKTRGLAVMNIEGEQ
jgi:thymidylate synthase (FAD)